MGPPSITSKARREPSGDHTARRALGIVAMVVPSAPTIAVASAVVDSDRATHCPLGDHAGARNPSRSPVWSGKRAMVPPSRFVRYIPSLSPRRPYIARRAPSGDQLKSQTMSGEGTDLTAPVVR